MMFNISINIIKQRGINYMYILVGFLITLLLVCLSVAMSGSSAEVGFGASALGIVILCILVLILAFSLRNLKNDLGIREDVLNTSSKVVYTLS